MPVHCTHKQRVQRVRTRVARAAQIGARRRADSRETLQELEVILLPFHPPVELPLSNRAGGLQSLEGRRAKGIARFDECHCGRDRGDRNSGDAEGEREPSGEVRSPPAAEGRLLAR